MTALQDLSEIINRGTGGNSGSPENLFLFKDARVAAAAAAATIAGRITSLWQYNGNPSGGVPPTTVAVPTNATAGSLKQTNPGGGRQKWLLGATAASSAAGTLLIYDRLLHIGNLSGTVATAQTVGGTLTRYTGTASVGNQIWLEIYTQIGVTGTTVSSIYTDQDGNSSTTQTTSIGNTGLREAQRIIPLTLASGNSGVRGVTSVTLAATTGTAGNFGISIIRPLMIIPLGLLGCGSVRDLIAGLPGIIEIQPDACISFAWLANSTAAPQIIGSLHMIES